MAELLKWQGNGLSAGTLTTASAGPGDTVPSGVTGPSGKAKIENAGTRPPRIFIDQNESGTNAAAIWSLGEDITTYAVRVYFSVGAWPGSGSAGGIVGRPVGSGISWRLDFTASGAIRFRGSSGTAIDSPSEELNLDTTYRLEVLVDNGSCQYFIYEGDSTVAVYSRVSGLTVGTDFGDLMVGQVNATLVDMRCDDISIHDTAALIGPAGTPLDTPAGFTFTSDPSEVKLTASWSAVAGADHYELEVQKLAGESWTAHDLITPATSPTVITAGLDQGTTYRARVRAMPEDA